MKLKQLPNKINSEALDDFLGISPNQMHVLLYGQLDEIQHIMCINSTFDQTLLENVPIVKKVLLLIRSIGELGEAKATQNGNLPKKIVNALYDFHSTKFSVPSEDYAPNILALRHAVTDCGWLKKRNRRFSLTKEGKQIFEKGFTALNYVTLLKYWLKNYNWSFTDGYPECAIVQQAAIFSLYILRQKAKEFFLTENFVQLFIKAFPMALELLAEDLKQAEEKLSTILCLRFLDRFASYFGLLDYVVNENLPSFKRDKQSQIRTTKLFAEVFCWFPPEKQNSAKIIKRIENNLLH